MIEHFLIGLLTVLLLAQNVFWAKVCLNLTNRIMSRNYGELRQAEAKPTIVKAPSLEEEMSDPYAEKQARELNTMFGMV